MINGKEINHILIKSEKTIESICNELKKFFQIILKEVF